MNLENSRRWLAREGIGILRNDIYGMGLYGEPPGETYYVDGNKEDDSYDGSDWDNAYKYLTTALAASHANIAISANRNWAGRNTIFCKADAFTEDLTKLAQKTDVIGVGSYNAGKQCGLIGNHVIAGTYQGCRFFNFRFEEVDTGIVWTLVAGQTGTEFHNCVWSARTTNPTIGLKATAVYGLHVVNSQFESVNGFTTAAINLKTGVTDDFLLENSDIGGAIGLLIDNGVTNTAGHIMVKNNTFDNLTMCVDDNAVGGAGIAKLVNNRFISAAAGGAAGGTIGNCLDIKVTAAIGNLLRSSDGCINVPSTDQEY